MKRSNSVFKFLAIALFMMIGFSAVATATSGDHNKPEKYIEAAALACFAAPLALLTAKPGTTKETHWRKNVPMALLLILPANNRPTYGAANPSGPANISGAINSPSNALTQNFGSNNTAISTSGDNQSPVAQVFADAQFAGALEYTYTQGATYAGGVIPLIPQLVSDVLPTGVTFSGSNFASFAAMANFMANNRVVLGDLVMITDDTTNFAKAMTITRVLPNGQSVPFSRTVNSVSKNFSQYDQTGRVLYKTGFVSGADIRYEIKASIPGTTNFISFIWEILGVNNVWNFQPAKF